MEYISKLIYIQIYIKLPFILLRIETNPSIVAIHTNLSFGSKLLGPSVVRVSSVVITDGQSVSVASDSNSWFSGLTETSCRKPVWSTQKTICTSQLILIFVHNYYCWSLTDSDNLWDAWLCLIIFLMQYYMRTTGYAKIKKKSALVTDI